MVMVIMNVLRGHATEDCSVYCLAIFMSEISILPL